MAIFRWASLRNRRWSEAYISTSGEALQFVSGLPILGKTLAPLQTHGWYHKLPKDREISSRSKNPAPPRRKFKWQGSTNLAQDKYWLNPRGTLHVASWYKEGTVGCRLLEKAWVCPETATADSHLSPELGKDSVSALLTLLGSGTVTVSTCLSRSRATPSGPSEGIYLFILHDLAVKLSMYLICCHYASVVSSRPGCPALYQALLSTISVKMSLHHRPTTAGCHFHARFSIEPIARLG